MIDDRSKRNIQTLLPKVQPLFREFLLKLKGHFRPLGIEAVVIFGTRTYEDQDALYAKGRNTKGKIVTHARGGYSNHNFGIAVDIGLFQAGRYLTEPNLYEEIGPVVREFPNLEWGGDWEDFKDTAHVQYRLPYTLAQLRDRVAKKQAIV